MNEQREWEVLGKMLTFGDSAPAVATNGRKTETIIMVKGNKSLEVLCMFTTAYWVAKERLIGFIYE